MQGVDFMQARLVRASILAATVLIGTAGEALAQWTVRGEGPSVEIGTTIDGVPAGLLLRCRDADGLELLLTHNGAVFDRSRDHTASLSVDGTATVLAVRARPGARPGDDDFVHAAKAGALDGLLAALGRGREVEISAPSGRYTLGLSGSSRSLAALREGCPAP